ncbi:MAG: ethanolamine ammonia-lyase subunit EutC [Oscillospiraceae bacterium]|nr:ethanolamine ammonia-lyase subunit EutC [Oscillospiraceae bacterium]
MNDTELMKIIREAIAQATQGEAASKCACKCECDGEVDDISAYSLREEFNIPNPYNKEEYMRIKAKTDARLGVWRAGPRPLTRTTLRVRADNAAAMDAVFNDVHEEYLERNNLKTYQTKCDSKETYLTRPDLGRVFDDETAAKIKAECINDPDVQIVVSDGLSSSAVEANIDAVLPAIYNGLKATNLKVGTPFFVKYGRVGAEDSVASVLGAKVTVILLGERPGLATSSSLSAYIVYGGYPGIPEANRTVVSNIHKAGTPPVEAGAYIAELCKQIFDKKASGLDLKA